VPEVGAFGVVRTNGLAARLIRAVTRSTVNHAFIYVGGGAVVEARPSGAGFAAVAAYPNAIWSHMDLQGKGPAIADAARALVGTPYSWVDCACIGLADLFGWHVPGPVRDRLTSRRHLMCSQLVDLANHEGGIDLYSDGRIPGDVAPGDLLHLIEGQPAETTSSTTDAHVQA
jgi:cell wall-associated NlpC family hydrolase